MNTVFDFDFALEKEDDTKDERVWWWVEGGGRNAHRDDHGTFHEPAAVYECAV